jgi:hypothetical protein
LRPYSGLKKSGHFPYQVKERFKNPDKIRTILLREKILIQTKVRKSSHTWGHGNPNNTGLGLFRYYFSLIILFLLMGVGINNGK